MARKLCFTLACLLALAFITGGCKHKAPNPVVTGDGYFKTEFQTEGEFVVDAIVSDLAEQMYFAKFHRLPDQKGFAVVAKENGGTWMRRYMICKFGSTRKSAIFRWL